MFNLVNNNIKVYIYKLAESTQIRSRTNNTNQNTNIRDISSIYIFVKDFFFF